MLSIERIEHTGADKLLHGVIVAAILTEIVVLVEPAPVDLLLLLSTLLAVLFGKLSFRGLTPAPVCALIVFLVANVVSLYDPFDPTRALLYLAISLYLVVSWITLVGLITRYGESFVRTMLATYVVAGVISAIFGVIGYFHLVPQYELFLLNGRAKGLFKDCNVYVPFFVPIALLAINFLLETGQSVFKKLMAGIALSTSLLAILLSFSRACWMNTAVSFAVFLAFRYVVVLETAAAKRKMVVQVALVFAVLGGSIGLLLSLPAVQSMMAMRVTKSGLQDYDRVRFATQELALKTSLERPLGIGPGQVEVLFDISTHSMYLRILSENGYLGLAAFLVFIGVTLARSLRMTFQKPRTFHGDLSLIVSACIVGHLVNSFVIDTVHWRHIWILYALAWMPAPQRCEGRTAIRSGSAQTHSLLVEA